MKPHLGQLAPFTRRCLLIAVATSLAACGNKGALTLPSAAAGTQPQAPTYDASPATSATKSADIISPPVTLTR